MVKKHTNSFSNYFGLEARIKFNRNLTEHDYASIGSFTVEIDGEREWQFDFYDSSQKNEGNIATYHCESLDSEYSEIDYDVAPLLATHITKIIDIFVDTEACDDLYPLSCEYLRFELEYDKNDYRKHEELIFTPETSRSLRKLNEEWHDGFLRSVTECVY